MGASHSRLEPYISLNPARAAVFKLVAAAFKNFFHRRRNPKIHRPANKSSIKPLRRDANDGVRNIIKALRLADDLWIAFEPVLPQLVTDYSNRVRSAPNLFVRPEAAAKNRPHSDRIEIICRDDAAGRNLGAVPDI